MRPMASNGMASSSFFPPNFLLHMAQQQAAAPPPHHDPQEQQHHHHHHEHQQQHQQHLAPPPPHHNPFMPSSQCPSSLQEFRGMAPMLGKRPMMYGEGGCDEAVNGCGGSGAGGEEEMSDDGSQAGEKKRRLNVEQVRTLEKNFELGNKLEPERKMQLARALGLQPRQVAIWFQNRRARWKTKQLEKDYDALKRQLDAVKAENDALLSHNKKLQAEIVALKGREAASELINLNKETEASCSNRSENSSEINLDISRTPPPDGAAPPPPAHHQGSQFRRNFAEIPEISCLSRRNFFNSGTVNPAHHHHHHGGGGGGGGGMIPFYPSVVARPAGVDIDQLLHSSSAGGAKMEHGHGGGAQQVVAANVDTASFGNLLCGVDEPPPFWPWPDHQHFH